MFVQFNNNSVPYVKQLTELLLEDFKVNSHVVGKVFYQILSELMLEACWNVRLARCVVAVEIGCTLRSSVKADDSN